MEESHSGGPDFRRLALVFLGGLLVWRVVYVALFPFALSPDESYYWDWTRSLDWSYFSKPPMVAWLIWLSTGVFGDNDFGVRLPAAVLGIGSLGFICLLGGRMFGFKAGFWAAAGIASSIGLTVGGYIMTIDAPLLFAWCMALYTFWRWQEGGKRAGVWLGLTILACGIGLLSKLIMGVFLALALVFVLSAWKIEPATSEVGSSTARGLPGMARSVRGLLLLAFGSVLFLAPFFLWNARYEWITFQHTGDAFGAKSWGMGKALSSAGEFVGSQVGLGSPVVMVLILVLLATAWRPADRRIRYLWCFSAVPLAMVLVLSFTQRINANWPLAFYPAAYIMVAAWATGHFPQVTPILPGWRRAFRPGVYIGFALVLLCYALPWLTGPLGLVGGKLDPAERLRTWAEAAEVVEPHWHDFHEEHQGFILVAGSRTIVSALAFYLEDQPILYRWREGDHIGTQYELWEGAETEVGRSALIVMGGKESLLPEALATRFQSTRELGTVTAESANGRHQRHYTLYIGEILEHWPSRPGPVVPR